MELTETEKSALSYLDWSDERLGQYCREIAKKLENKKIDGYHDVVGMAASFILCSIVQSCNAGELTLELNNITSEQFPEPTSWKITIEKTTN